MMRLHRFIGQVGFCLASTRWNRWHAMQLRPLTFDLLKRWVCRPTVYILHRKSSVAAGAIRRNATRLGLYIMERKSTDDCADYLVNEISYLDYELALFKGWPISKSVIEGARRYLVEDRRDIDVRRRSPAGVEAFLMRRAIIANDDFYNYWRFHISHEFKQNQFTRFGKVRCPLDRSK